MLYKTLISSYEEAQKPCEVLPSLEVALNRKDGTSCDEYPPVSVAHLIDLLFDKGEERINRVTAKGLVRTQLHKTGRSRRKSLREQLMEVIL